MRGRFWFCLVVAALCLLGLLGQVGSEAAKPRPDVRAEAPGWEWLDPSMLRVLTALASDYRPEEAAQREEALKSLYREFQRARGLQQLVLALDVSEPESDYARLAAARSAEPADYLAAMGESYARFKGAQDAGQWEWMAKQLTAAKKYAELAARSFASQLAADQSYLSELEKKPFAIRRPRERAMAFTEELQRQGLGGESRALLLESGFTEAEIDVYLKELLAMPADRIGASIQELFSEVARFRRELVAWLEAFAKAGGERHVGVGVRTFVVDNPHDREETVDLYIRRVSIPEGWRLAIVDVPAPGNRGAAAAKAKAQPLVREDTPGVRYQVRLPAKGRMRVASVVTPVGPLGENTTARWAVEGYIGNELIGGMMHEMHVPAILPDLKLPPIGATSSAPWRGAQWWLRVVLGVAVLLALSLFLLFLARSRRRKAANG